MWEFYSGHNDKFLLIQIVNMKVILTVTALCRSAPDLVGETVEVYVEKRKSRHLERGAKRTKILDAIMKKPKKFFGISEDMILKFVSQKEFREKVRRALKNLTDWRYQNLFEETVFEFDDDRTLRGE